jgi:hypothetical protein
MKQEYKDLLIEAILPRLVDITVEGELPLDMTELDYHHFEEAIEKWIATRESYKMDI